MKNDYRKNYGILTQENVQKAFDFAVRKHLNGGQMELCPARVRTSTGNFLTSFAGKLGEFAVYQFLSQYSDDVTEPDLEVWNQNIEKHGDGGVDMYFRNVAVDIKTSTECSRWLLHEVARTDLNNLVADMYTFVRVNYAYLQDWKRGHKNATLEELQELCFNRTWVYQYCGCINKDDFVLGADKHVLKAGSYSWIDEDNYGWNIRDLKLKNVDEVILNFDDVLTALGQ